MSEGLEARLVSAAPTPVNRLSSAIRIFLSFLMCFNGGGAGEGRRTYVMISSTYPDDKLLCLIDTTIIIKTFDKGQLKFTKLRFELSENNIQWLWLRQLFE